MRRIPLTGRRADEQKMQVRILHPLQRLFVEILLNNYLDGSSTLPTSTNRPCKSESMVWLAEKQITIFGGAWF